MSRAAETGRKRLRGSHLGRLRPGAGVIRRAASFRVKVMGIVLLITLTVGGAAIGQTRRDLYQTLTGELENRGRSLALDLSTLGADSLLTRDLFALNVLLAETLEHNPDVVYAFYVDDRGMVAADTFPTGVPTDILAAEPAEVPRTGQTSILLVQTEEGLLRDVRAPILGGKAGVVRLGMTESRVESLIAAATRRLLYVTLLAAGVAVSAGLVLSYVLVSPLRALVEAMRAVGQGDLARRVAPRSEDEVGFLAESFNAMVEELGIQTERSRVIQEAVERNNRELRILQQLSSEEAGIMPPDAYVERAAGLVVEQLAGSTARICLWQGLNDDARLCTAEPGGPPVWLARHELSAGSDAGCPVAGALSGGDCTAECDHVCAGAGGTGDVA
ncbi:MAG: HAMP domain-containing protein [Thermoleophilia bacterium]|nr:HAMP domain-containing protein [Thermoleophilia bacterium]